MTLEQQLNIVRLSFTLQNFHIEEVELTYLFPLIYLPILALFTSVIYFIKKASMHIEIKGHDIMITTGYILGMCVGYSVLISCLIYLMTKTTYVYSLYFSSLSILYLPFVVMAYHTAPRIKNVFLVLFTLFEIRFVKECLNALDDLAVFKRWVLVILVCIIVLTFYKKILLRLEILESKTTYIKPQE